MRLVTTSRAQSDNFIRTAEAVGFRLYPSGARLNIDIRARYSGDCVARKHTACRTISAGGRSTAVGAAFL